MSKEAQLSEVHFRKELGTTRSYLVGFLLSLLLTILSYYLVVNRSFSGTALLGIILSFAVIQMIVQIFFFLHLGRGPKPFYNIFFFVSTLAIILVVVVGSLFIMTHLHYNMSPNEITKNLAQKERIYQLGGAKTGACKQSLTKHKIIIDNGSVSPAYIRAHICDSLTFVSQDDNLHEITFGSHPAHDSYAGEDNLVLRKSRNKTIILNHTGAYTFHDHLNPEIVGSFTVVD